MSRNEDSHIELSSGNVFADLGLPDAGERQTKAEIAHHVAAAIREIGKPQKEIAGILGVPEPKLSALLNGRLAGFTLERLTGFLAILHDSEIHTKKAAPHKSAGRAVG